MRGREIMIGTGMKESTEGFDDRFYECSACGHDIFEHYSGCTVVLSDDPVRVCDCKVSIRVRYINQSRTAQVSA
jgi:hypothetical protein